MGTFLTRWTEDAAPSLRPTSLRRYRQVVLHYVAPADDHGAQWAASAGTG